MKYDTIDILCLALAVVIIILILYNYRQENLDVTSNKTNTMFGVIPREISPEWKSQRRTY